jgi:hypothetical protein
MKLLLAILCAGAACWILAFVWYSLLFGKMWAAEQMRLRGERPSPGGGMAPQLISTFVSNLIAAAGMSYLFRRTGIADLGHALRLGAAAGIGFSCTTVTIISVWEGKSTKLWLIDAGYYFVAALLMAVIFVSWP